jgi:hypothetical protein
VATQVTLYHTNVNTLNTTTSAVQNCAAQWGEPYGPGGNRCYGQHDIYRRNGGADYEIALNVGSWSQDGDGNDIAMLATANSWTPSSTVEFGASDYLKIVLNVTVMADTWGYQGTYYHDHALTDVSAGRGTLQTTAVPLAVSWFDNWSYNVDESYYCYHTSGGSSSTAGYIKPTFEAGAAASDYMIAGKFWGA